MPGQQVRAIVFEPVNASDFSQADAQRLRGAMASVEGYGTTTSGAVVPLVNRGVAPGRGGRKPDLTSATLRASFQGIAFPVTSLTDNVSNDAAVHRAYMVPGAQIEPTGYAPRSGTFTVQFDNGIPWGDGTIPLFPDVFQAFLASVRNSPIGDLVHPHYGPIRALISNVRIDTRGTVRSGVLVSFAYTEDGEYEPPDVADNMSALLDEAGQFDSTVATYRNPSTTGGYSGQLQAELRTQSTDISYVGAQAAALSNAPTLSAVLSQAAVLSNTLLLNISIIKAWPADLAPFSSPILTSTFAMLGLTGLVVPGQAGAVFNTGTTTAQGLVQSFMDFAAFSQVASSTLQTPGNGRADVTTRVLQTAMTPSAAAALYYGDSRYVDLILQTNGPPGRTGMYPANTVLTLVPVAGWSDYSSRR